MSKAARSRTRKPKSRAIALRHETEYQRVLLALYVNAEDGKSVCYATNTYLAEELGMSVATVRRAIEAMQKRRVIKTFDWRDGITCKIHVIVDHPHAKRALKELNWYRRDARRRQQIRHRPGGGTKVKC